MSSPSTPGSLDGSAAEPARARRWWRDPRTVVLVAALVALLVAGLTSWSVTSSIRDRRGSVDRVAQELGPPLAHLLETERMNTDGQAALLGAASTTGAERTGLLSESIAASQGAAAAWSEYRASALGLPGEDAVADRYEAAQREVQAATTALLVPILNSAQPGTLPTSQIELHQSAERDLRELHDMYDRAAERDLADLRTRIDRYESNILATSAAALAVLLIATGLGLRRAQRVRRDRNARTETQRLVAFETRLRRALELIDSESSAFRLAERATAEMAPGSAISVLVSDSSRATLEPVGQAPACGVSSPGDCPALRSTSTVTMADSRDLDACPILAARGTQPCSATCVPITVGGRAGGLVQIVGEPGATNDGTDAAALVARGVGDRVTLIEALATFQLQAARDPLTGLLNRRSLMLAVEELLERSTPYSLAFCDLDHFKKLNDLHGHEAGDRALRSFARTLTESLRPQDVICRWGGEEFVIVLPDCDVAAAVEAMERVRSNLLLGSMSSQSAVVTASFGIATSTDGSDFDDVVGLADVALRAAKESGRDRVVRFDSLPLSGRAPKQRTMLDQGTH